MHKYKFLHRNEHGTLWDPEYTHPGVLIPTITRTLLGREPVSILDVGGGGGTVGGDWGGGKRIDVIDIFPPKTTPPNFTLGDGRDIVKIYGERSFDVVMSCEVLEHLKFEDGPDLLDAMEAVAVNLVILTTTHGFQEQSPEDYPGETWSDNPHQKHISGWCHTDLEALGYTVFFHAGDVFGESSQLVAWKLR